RYRYRRTAVAAGAATVAAALLATAFTTGSAEAAGSGAAPGAAGSSGTSGLKASAGANASAVAAAARHLGLGAKEKLIVRDVIKDPDGTVHTRYERTYAGLPVLGGDLVVHQARSGNVEDVTKATEAAITVPTTAAKQAPDAARTSALAAARTAKGLKAGAAPTVKTAPRKVVWAAKGKPVLAYETVLGGFQDDGTPSKLHVITDAATGEKLHQYQAVETGTGTGQYSGKVPVGSVKSGTSYLMKDNARGGHQTYNLQGAYDGKGKPFLDADDVWGNGQPTIQQTAAVDAQYGAAVTWDFYKNVLGRNGIKNDGKAAYSRVHFATNYVNAFWDDDCFCMTYGDGEGNKKPLTSLDVAGHEMSHGVTSATANLEYSGESGGLNEATSDILGTAVEFYAKNPAEPGDYLIGKQIDINGDGTPLRYMDNPSKDHLSPDYWGADLGDLDVHYSSGVANHFFFLLAEGSGPRTIDGVDYDSPTVDGQKIDGIGRDKAVKIWYKALTTYMISTTDYKGARTATLKAAWALYGHNSAEFKAVGEAWKAVDVK
ncbi:M4 family metallopeptidase, partial [Streptomyces sp. NPDC057654]|uniref:M4 family metallopeptidase n=1 Tax=Streptomyces sp. NPDC057654 TaxID=3346196 RepID=UPI00367685C2